VRGHRLSDLTRVESVEEVANGSTIARQSRARILHCAAIVILCVRSAFRAARLSHGNTRRRARGPRPRRHHAFQVVHRHPWRVTRTSPPRRLISCRGSARPGANEGVRSNRHGRAPGPLRASSHFTVGFAFPDSAALIALCTNCAHFVGSREPSKRRGHLASDRGQHSSLP
jgi:hypothetical protein